MTADVERAVGFLLGSEGYAIDTPYWVEKVEGDTVTVWVTADPATQICYEIARRNGHAAGWHVVMRVWPCTAVVPIPWRWRARRRVDQILHRLGRAA